MEHDSEVVVKFYDGVKSKVALSEVFPIPRDKHASDVRYITLRERQLVGQVVVAWNDHSNTFELGAFSAVSTHFDLPSNCCMTTPAAFCHL